MVLLAEQYERGLTKATCRHKGGTCWTVCHFRCTPPRCRASRVIYLLVDASERRQNARSLVFAKLKQEDERCDCERKGNRELLRAMSLVSMERYCCARSIFFFGSINNQNNVFHTVILYNASFI